MCAYSVVRKEVCWLTRLLRYRLDQIPGLTPKAIVRLTAIRDANLAIRPGCFDLCDGLDGSEGLGALAAEWRENRHTSADE